MELYTKISLYIFNRSIDEITLRALEIIKGFIHPVRCGEYDTILSYARFIASNETVRELNDDIFQELIVKEFLNN